MTVVITEYLVKNNQDYPSHHCPVYSGRTASGVQVSVGMAAADWSVFPKGTKILVPGFKHNGGQVVVTDTGGLIVGPHIDLAVASCYEALKLWGTQTETISYLEPKHG
jgi:3D (Asp-Asp-Asp) domain-containing protein